MALARAGAQVAFTYSENQAAVADVLRESADMEGHVVAFRAQVESYTQARQVVEEVQKELGDLDGIVLNAGITRDKLLAFMPEESWDDVLATNLKGVFNYAHAAIYSMIRQRAGRVICVSSVSGALMGVAGQTNYGATKAAQIGFVKSLAKEVAAYGITVNAVAPGFIETDIWMSIPKPKRESVLKSIPLARPGKPEEVASVICFLLSEEASYITGSVLVIDGGLSA
jgi:3-oxoacyl-[acyl-carrier protein] reductase